MKQTRRSKGEKGGDSLIFHYLPSSEEIRKAMLANPDVIIITKGTDGKTFIIARDNMLDLVTYLNLTKEQTNALREGL